MTGPARWDEVAGPLRVSLDDDLLREASDRAAGMGDYRGTIRGRQANLVGAVGELVAIRYLTGLGLPVEDHTVPGYDLLVDGHRMDVKTKERFYRPSPTWECSVTEQAFARQKPDVYLFLSLVSDRERRRDPDRFVEAFVLGSITRERFEVAATYVPLGWTDPDNGWVASKACWNLPVADLDRPRVRRQHEPV